ncbi:hypothetical protein niasHT_026071 [Heterodera trifolii]|uniref:BTB domain-containing protein n=1 Tax=Heterodera trifolii TaxID=157864 RepID=A0ABD2KR70_9BILA
MGTSQSPPNIDQQEKDGKYKRSGQIVFRVNEFAAFAGGTGQKRMISDSSQSINGLNWRMALEHSGTELALFVLCEGDENDKAWSCLASVRKSIVACKFGNQCFAEEEETRALFHAESREKGSKSFIKFAQLMDPNNGWYDGQEDAVTFIADIVAERPNGMPGAFLKDILLVNDETVYMNKYLLAAHSEFFEELFFGEKAQPKPKIQIENVADAVPHFERLIATMYPQNKELDAECVEGILELADRFLLDSVKNRCVQFLAKSSAKSAVFKLRVAEKYNLDALKDKRKKKTFGKKGNLGTEKDKSPTEFKN